LPIELEIGAEMEFFRQTPWQLGFTDEMDFALKDRAMEAIQVFRAAHAYRSGIRYVQDSQWSIVVRLRREIIKRRNKEQEDEWATA
jgi:hypothetical protein